MGLGNARKVLQLSYGRTCRKGKQIFVGEVLPSRRHAARIKVSGVVYQYSLQFGNL